MKIKTKKITCAFVVAIIFTSLLLFSRGIYGSESTSVSLDPPVISGQSFGIGATFAVTAYVSNVNGLCGWSLGLSWDPSVLQLMNSSEGSFLRTAGQTSVTSSPIDNSAGVIQNINDILTNQGNVSGSGDLAIFLFQIINFGSTQLTLTNVQLLAPIQGSGPSNPLIPATVANAAFSYSEPTMAFSAASSAVASAVKSGTTSTLSITVGPSPDPMGSSISIDVRVDNVANLWGWTLDNVNWNASILQLTSVSEGPFLGTGGGTSFIGDSSQLWDNTGGSILGGLSEALRSNVHAVGTAGVLATLTFNVTGYGTTPLTISSFTVYSSSSDIGSSATCNSALISVLPSGSPTPTPTPSSSPTPTPTPTNPTNPVANFNPANGTTFSVGAPILLDGSASTAGWDGMTCDITNYAWLVQYSNMSLFGSYSGKAVSFIVSAPTTLKITLIVTAPDLKSVPSSSYSNTSTTNAWIQIVPSSTLQNASIDVFTDKGGVGQNVDSGPYGPQELVKVYALVTYNNAPVVGKLVAFDVMDPNGTVVSLTSALSNATGYANWEFRLPWPDTNQQSLFGNWSIVASVDISQVVVTDTLHFKFNYLINIISITGIQTPASVQRSQSIQITINLQATANMSALLTVTICDDQEVPVAFAKTTINSGSGGLVSSTITVTIPSWAFVGTATTRVNVMTNLPTAGGVPLCPESTSNFQIKT